MAKGKLFFWSCLTFVIGICAVSFVNFPVLFLRGFFIFAIALALPIIVLCLAKRKKIALFCFAFQVLCFAFIFGVWRYQLAAGKMFQAESYKLAKTEKSVVLIGVADGDSKMSEKSQQLRVVVKGNGHKEIVLVVTGRYPEYHYGDRIKITGNLEMPENFDEFDYQGWLAKDGIFSQMIFPEIELLETGQGSLMRQNLAGFKNRFQETWQKLLSPPHLGIFEALVFGEEENISREWKDRLNFSGTRHLTAVSGMNITVISFLLVPLFLSLGLWKNQANWLALTVIWLYILMIGFPASALRAGIMVSLFFLDRALGRQVLGERILVFAAAILLLENPLLLRFDPGFQLSFLAVAGLVFWEPFFKDRVFKKGPRFLKEGLSVVFAAQVFTLPLVVHNFGYLSLVSPLTNVLIGPIVPYLTMAGFILGSLAMVLPIVGQVFAWFFWLAASYILLVVDLALKIPLAKVPVANLSWIFLLPVYAFLIWLTWKMKKRQALTPRFLQF